MRIGIVTDNYFPSVGGTEISIRSYKRRLERMGHKVFIFCPSLGRNNPPREGKDIIRLRSIRRIYRDHPLMYIYPGITKQFKEYDLDVIHSQTPFSASLIARHVCRRLDLPFILTIHTLVPEQVRLGASGGLFRAVNFYLLQSLWLRDFHFPRTFIKRSEQSKLELRVRLSWVFMLRLTREPDMVIFPTEYVRNLFRYRGFNNQSAILPTFTDMYEKRPMASERTARAQHRVKQIIYVGRLDKEKRPTVLIKAARHLPKDIKWKIVFVGDGTLRFRLKQLTKLYKLQDRVEFMGSLSQNKIAGLLKKSDIFVMTSYRFDTQGIVLLEAAGAGLPIVYCDDKLTVGVGPENAILTGRKPEEMAGGITKLLKRENLRQKLAVNSIQENKDYHPEKLTQELIDIYATAQLETQAEVVASTQHA